MALSETSAAGTPPQPRRAGARRVLLWAGVGLLLLALSGALAYYVWLSDEKQDIIEGLTISQEKLEAEIEGLDKEMKTLDAQLAEANQNIAQKEAELKRVTERIAFLQSQVATYIRQGKVVEAERDRYQGMYQQLMFYNSKYRQEIDRLKHENADLRALNDSLQQHTSDMAEQNRDIRDSLLVYEHMVSTTKVLSTFGWKFIAVKRSREISGSVLEARDIADKLRICFTIPTNASATRGTRTVYAAILGPNTTTKTVQGVNGNSSTFRMGSGAVPYSARTQIDFQGQALPVCIDYEMPPDGRFEPGAYTVKVYADGFIIGEDGFSVR